MSGFGRLKFLEMCVETFVSDMWKSASSETNCKSHNSHISDSIETQT